MNCPTSCRRTSKRVATIASKALRNKHSSTKLKSISASAVAQRKNCKKVK